MIVLLLIIIGLCFGSMVNALVWRLHWQEQRAEESKLKRAAKKFFTFGRLTSGRDRYSMLTGRSMCIHCKQELAAKDLIPVISWLFLRGKCRYCKKPISLQYPLVEIATATLFAVSYIFWPLPLGEWYQWLNFGVWCVYIVGLMALFMYDLRWYLLPDKIVWPLVALALANAVIQTLAQPQLDILNAAQFYVFGLLPIAGFYWLIHVFSKGKLVGLGDVKLGIFIGLALGWPLTLLTLFLANVLGTIFTVPLMLTGKLKRNSRVPFGPFLITAFVISGLWGMHIIDWYLSGLGL